MFGERGVSLVALTTKTVSSRHVIVYVIITDFGTKGAESMTAILVG